MRDGVNEALVVTLGLMVPFMLRAPPPTGVPVSTAGTPRHPSLLPSNSATYARRPTLATPTTLCPTSSSVYPLSTLPH